MFNLVASCFLNQEKNTYSKDGSKGDGSKTTLLLNPETNSEHRLHIKCQSKPIIIAISPISRTWNSRPAKISMRLFVSLALWWFIGIGLVLTPARVSAGGRFSDNDPYSGDTGRLDLTVPNFPLILNCPETLDCGNFKKSALDVLARMNSVLRIVSPIRVIAGFFKPCSAELASKSDTCKTSSTLGFASPAAMHPVKFSTDALKMQVKLPSGEQISVGPGVNDVYQVTQAQLVQLRKLGAVDTKDAVFSDAEITASFNIDRDWWFADSGVEIKPNQIDFAYIFLHEMLHGLGFGHESYGNSAAPPNSLLPDQVFTTSTIFKTSYYYGFPSLWDAFTLNVMDKSSPAALVADYESFRSKSVAVGSSAKSAENLGILVLGDPKLKQAAEKLYGLSTSSAPAVGFAMRSDGSADGNRNEGPPGVGFQSGIAAIHTVPNKFQDGTSLSHLSTQLVNVAGGSTSNSENAGGTSKNSASEQQQQLNIPVSSRLMLPGTKSGDAKTTPSAISSSYKSSGIDLQSLQILYTMGYEIEGFSNTPAIKGTVVYNASKRGVGISSSTDTLLLHVLVLTCISLSISILF